MKKSFIRNTAFSAAVFTMLSTTTLLTGCNSPKEKLDDATTEVVDASADLVKANDAYLAEVESFKADVAQKIAANELSLKEYNAKLVKKSNATLKKKIAELDSKNQDLKKKLADFKAEESKETWAEFKTEFNHDMDGLGKAFSDLTIENTDK